MTNPPDEWLNDLVYVHYNLLLQNRLKENKRSYDLVDYQSIDKTEFWVVDEVEEGELNYDELENMLDEEQPINLETSTSQAQTSEGVDDEYDDLVIIDEDDNEDELDAH
ncbi:hypothetical protein L1987_18384 [Smallanthus sonchifolius]|uniref:Uncharacterized protein n=1 Tax=Smallanthus sonchifolius TaxID=185202 RepID=A0ACB9J1K5_9ASTR|nr:hypothetical protein L1987_18384 [Smallanthus sonchifolius]